MGDTMSHIFQLTAVSQNDPQCSIGSQLTATITSYNGGTLTANSSPLTVDLPIPPPPTPPPSPTWFLALDHTIKDASFSIEIAGPPGTQTTAITINGSDMPGWVAQNEKEKTNQIYKQGTCGIFGFAQRNVVEGQGVYWIYTVTGGVCDPQVHPPGA